MLFLYIACDNIFMFKDFFLDFTYERKISHYLATDDTIFPNSQINVRKKMLILGGNASGKTTFGVLMCAINNYIMNVPVTNSRVNLYNAIYDRTKESYFMTEFVIDDNAYRVYCKFNKQGIIEEYLKKVKVYKSYNIKKLRSVLDEAPFICEYHNYKQDETITNTEIFMSSMLGEADSYIKEVGSKVAFHYLFSNYSNQTAQNKINVGVDVLNNILPGIDNSVDKVVSLNPSDKDLSTNSYLIVFKNGSQVTIPEGDLTFSQKDRLSHGTYEALTFLNVLQELKTRPDATLYIDEKLPHLHAELEAFLIMKALLIKRSAQVFFTSHNSELLDLNVPNNAFLLFKRCKEGFNKAMFVSQTLNKNDRSVRNYYENDYFGVLPDYSALDQYFEDIVS